VINATDMACEWPVWRLVVARVATLTELDCSWSYDDLVRAGMAMDIDDAMRRGRS
jgi:hypothetical protein